MPGRKKPSVYSLALKEVQHPHHEEQGQSDIQTSGQSDIQMSRQLGSQPSSQLDSQPAKPRRIKATFYLRPDDIIAIDEMQTKRFRAEGKKPEKSELVSEAIQLLATHLTD
jgi:hypothetical protein